jgi:Lar family restriction alleviation protein
VSDDTSTAQTVPKLEPCPFCGGADVEQSDNEDKDWYPNTFWVQCGCGARGPDEFNGLFRGGWGAATRTDGECRTAAIAAWNRRASGWQPIETAPRDGTIILTWITHRATDNGGPVNTAAIVSWWGPDADCWVERDSFDTVRPTHWQPLPPAPEPTP